MTMILPSDNPAPDPSLAPLHELNPTGRFSDRVADYVRFRPTYPTVAIDRVLDGLGDPLSLSAADVGAGTGISSLLLAERGVSVHAVEPNAEMLAAAPRHPRIRPVNGLAEATTLAARSCHLVLCAQAFHWFRVAESLAEFARILRKPGRLALMWNKRDRHDSFTSRYTEAIRAVASERQAEMMPFDPSVLDASGVFGRVASFEYPHSQRLDREGLVGRATSASYVPKSGPGLEKLIPMLHDAHQEFADAQGFVELRYLTQVFLAAPI